MSTFIPPTPAATKSAEQHEEPSEQDSFSHLLFKVLRLTSEQVQDLNDWMKHRGIPNVHEIIVQNFRNPHELKDDLQFIRESKTYYIQANVNGLIVSDDHIHQAPSVFGQSQAFWTILLHPE